ncbi:D-glycero-beta-D-manno-heptose 1-phosphate adenylyltransferase [Bacteriovorax sp. DB6_IX]|uniref:D-glycero-beta-D-manno-heptose 1-phosphate adenylyltransferase n=1 Tax=Bacteriovorax sp. DB6_IX TaxID=1353530 RepID=UPI00038A4E02|nr:D-glycero-beta-D-manno-heptose 1-phosphate adenylyltransferase [Bacteriovorax sp. DB6_IX]EQC51343.1 bifunctional protein RfaE, domain II [Bacteriovorax sp. DB6_IX]
MSLESILENREGKKLVFTNGCFDILHKGHVSYLNEARAQGDFLIVGLNSDASVKRLKGDHRPVNNELDRTFMLENLKAVDAVAIFEEDTPYNLISRIQPDVLVKGGDWAVEDIVGHDIVTARGGEVKSLRFEEGYSTTGLINKVQGRS